ncbi:MAG: DNA-processing protein DprA, partial [Coriobacteriia bacterium]|nr:DNA-processing protein DprA [Coriobacteriia bacterium]
PDRFALTLDDQSYPKCLRALSDPPRTLYGIGRHELLTEGLGVVGSRKATPYGLTAARIFAGWAAQQGIVIVSGAAIGCDQAAHLAALDRDGPTVAVLGCGADIDYPTGAGALLDNIRRDGLVLSELPWGALPKRWAFVRRNRIIAGLSHALLVVEASLPSGTFSTADFALDAGRSVCAVPGSIFAPESRGANRLIRQGATPITDVSELAQALDVLDLVCCRSESSLCQPSDNRLVAALVADPMRPDDIAREFGMDIVEVVRILAELEERRLARRFPDGRWGCLPM